MVSQRKYIISILAVLIFTLLQGFCIYADNKEFEISVIGGYGDTALVGYDNPFKIKLKSSAKGFDGELQVKVSDNNNRKVLYAEPVRLEPNTQKEITMYVPIKSVSRKAAISLVSGGWEAASVNYSFKKMLSPEVPVIGIVSDNKKLSKSLAGIQMPQKNNYGGAFNNQIVYASNLKTIYASKYSSYGCNSQVYNANYLNAQVLNLDNSNLPDTKAALNAFNILIINDLDTSTLASKQNNSLSDWVEAGNILVVGTGSNWKKAYSGLPKLLDIYNPYLSSNSEIIKKYPASLLSEYIDANKLSGEIELLQAIKLQKAKAIPQNKQALALTTNQGKGVITVLTFDPSAEPFNSWDSSTAFWEKLISESANVLIASNEEGYSGIYDFNTLQGMATNILEDQTPPYTAIFIAILIYIIIAGPILYIIMKLRDKRDWLWVGIPLLSVIFVALIYIFGFQTRFDMPVTNDISLTIYDSKYKTVTTAIASGIYNNRRGDLKVAYDKSWDINFFSNDYYGYNPNNDNNSIAYKHVNQREPFYEIYNSGLWEPKLINASKTSYSFNEIISDIIIKNGKISLTLYNATKHSFNDTMLSIGNNFIDAGSLKAGEKKHLSFSFNNNKFSKSIDDFVNQKYKLTMNGPRDKDGFIKQRKRDAFLNIFNMASNNSVYNSSTASIRFSFIALTESYKPIEYIVNNQQTKSFGTNIIYSYQEGSLKKGSQIELPEGIINSELSSDQDTANANTGGYGTQRWVYIFNDSDYKFDIIMPDTIKPESFTVSFKSFIPYYAKSNYTSASKTQKFNHNKYTYYIYNNNDDEWEKIPPIKQFSKHLDEYIDSQNKILVKASAIMSTDDTLPKEEVLGFPNISVKGVGR